MKRLRFLLSHLSEIAVKIINKDYASSNYSVLCKYEEFVKTVNQTYSNFLNDIILECEEKIKDDFYGITKIIDWDISTATDAPEY